MLRVMKMIGMLSVAEGALQQSERKSLADLLMMSDPTAAFTGALPVRGRAVSPSMKLDGQNTAEYYKSGGASEFPMKQPMGKKELKKFWTKLEAKGKAGSNLKKIPDKKAWVNFVNGADVAKPGMIAAGLKFGQEVAVVNDRGTLYGISNKLPPTGQPATFGKLNGDGTITDPVSGNTFELKTGKLKGPWCPSVLGNIQKLLFKPSDLGTYTVKKQGNAVAAQINTNLQKQFEQKYWRGVLDAQGKVDGAYY